MIRRLKTRIVNIGDIPLGGHYPIRLQSMTTTDTMDTSATVEQSIRIINAGADYVRITAPSIKEAQNLRNIKEELKKRGYNTPLIADIHFTPNAAEIAARIVEKVRINPGNYADKKKFEVIEYTDSQYNEELERIRNKFVPLIKVCKEYGTAMRIGTNHGSLSDRIMSRFGDTPLGMVESALEFLRICVDENYYNIVLSMKSSNPRVMVEAYRMLVRKMAEENMDFPLHLGVTEAGDGEDGRIKSALGIGTLLDEGIGDTIRVSLTEEPEFEIPVCRELVNKYYHKLNETALSAELIEFNSFKTYQIRGDYQGTYAVVKTGGKNVPSVVISAGDEYFKSHQAMRNIGYYYSETLDKWTIGDASADYIYLGSMDIDYNLPGTIVKVFDYPFWQTLKIREGTIPILSLHEYKDLSYIDFDKFLLLDSDVYIRGISEIIKRDKKAIIVIENNNSIASESFPLGKIRTIMEEIQSAKILNPVIFKISYSSLNDEQLTIYSSIDAGGLFIDGYGNGIWLESNSTDDKIINNISFGILQAARVRISKTEYISCPSCGRTLFDLQETTAKVREKTSHLKGLKIGIMGCIVNGPGEMADADYGYVGSGVGKITLYKGKEVVKRSIDSAVAVEELINLIKENGDWVDP